MLLASFATSQSTFAYGLRGATVGAGFAVFCYLGLRFGQRPPPGTDARGRWQAIQIVGLLSPLIILAGVIMMLVGAV